MQSLPAGPVTSFPLIARPRPETLDRLEAQITELWGHLNAATYRFLRSSPSSTAAKAMRGTGSPSTAHWLNWQCGIGKVAAREKVRVARALESLPEISAAFASGEFSYSKVRAMTRVATPANESVLVSIGRHGTATHVEKLVKKYRWTQRRDAERDCSRAAAQPPGPLRSTTTTRRSCCNARLPPEVGALVEKALAGGGATCVREQRVRDERDELRPHVDVESVRVGQRQHAHTARTGPTRYVSSSRRSSRRAPKRPRRRRARTAASSSCTSIRPCSRRPSPRATSEPHRCELDAAPRSRSTRFAVSAATARRRHRRRPRRRAAQHRPQDAQHPASAEARVARARRRLPLPGLRPHALHATATT